MDTMTLLLWCRENGVQHVRYHNYPEGGEDLSVEFKASSAPTSPAAATPTPEIKIDGADKMTPDELQQAKAKALAEDLLFHSA